MAVNLVKGQKMNLTKENPGLSQLLVGLGWNTNQYYGGADFDLDAVAFLVDESGAIRSNADMVYYGNLRHASGGVTHMGDSLTGGAEGDDERILIDLCKIPPAVQRIVIAVTIYEADSRRQNFGQVSDAYVRVVDQTKQQEIMCFPLHEDFSTEASLVVGEIYRYKGEWKFNAVGAGLNGGLRTLCRMYGANLQITDVTRGAVLLKKGKKINLAKDTTAQGAIKINLNWSRSADPSRHIDLDLGCLYELTDGSKSAVQALGNAFGRLNKPPYILLDRDDRGGSIGENMTINGAMIPNIRRILVYTFIYEGITNWQEADGVVTVQCPGRRDIVVRMDQYGSNRKMCAIALLENKTGNALSMEKVVEFFYGHRDMDKRFQWGLEWRTGKK